MTQKILMLFNLLLVFIHFPSFSISNYDLLCSVKKENGDHYCDDYGIHCGSIKEKDNFVKKCNRYNLSKDHCLDFSLPDGRDCMCNCSCVAGETPILMADKSFKLAKDIVEGDEVFSPYSLNSKSVVSFVTINQVDEYPAIKITFNESAIIVTDNHIFVKKDKKITTAREIKSGDKLLNKDGDEITVTSINLKFNYSGGLYNFFINENNTDPKEHILVAGKNNIQSGDYLIQSENDNEKFESLNDNVLIKNID